MSAVNHIEVANQLVETLMDVVNSSDVHPAVAIAASARLFAQICRDCDIEKEQFVIMCKELSERNNWKSQGEENGKAE